jgi:hypothetical protein
MNEGGGGEEPREGGERPGDVRGLGVFHGEADGGRDPADDEGERAELGSGSVVEAESDKHADRDEHRDSNQVLGGISKSATDQNRGAGDGQGTGTGRRCRYGKPRAITAK